MKKFTILALLVFTITLSNAQYVTIPDANFRNALKGLYPSCFNASDMMDTTCSKIVNALGLGVNNKNISSLEGIQYFKSLWGLYCDSNNLVSIPRLNLSLQTLSCKNNRLENLPELPNSLTVLDCSKNELTTIPELPNGIIYLLCDYNKLTTLSVGGIDFGFLSCQYNNLNYLNCAGKDRLTVSCSNNQITDLSVSVFSNYGGSVICDNNLLTNLDDVNVEIVYCNNNLITSIDNLNYEIQELYCRNNLISEINSISESITALDCSNNQLTSLPNFPQNLYYLNCANNQLTSLPSLNENMGYLDFSHNKIDDFPEVLEYIYLDYLNCSYNQLVSLPLSNDLFELNYLDCSYNHLTNLPESIIAGCEYVDCSNNHLTSLPILSEDLTNLKSMNNRELECLPFLPETLDSLFIKGTSITCIPNEIVGKYVDTILPICLDTSFICIESPLALGFVYLDKNKNGTFNLFSDSILPEHIIFVSPNESHGSSDYRGQYIVKLDSGINNYWSCWPKNKYSIVTPTLYNYKPEELGIIPEDFNFGLQYLDSVRDLSISLASSPARPGFTTNVFIRSNNEGTIAQSNITIKLKKSENLLLVSSSIPPDYEIDDTLIWINQSLGFEEKKSIELAFQVPSTIPLGSLLVYEAWIEGIDQDTTPDDNYSNRSIWIQPVRGSHDPNDKLVSKTSLAPNYDVEKDRLIYTIRFQNTGTDTAFYVRVKDEIPDNLNISTLRVINASHDYQLIVREKNIVEFVFPNIFLPDSGTNEPKSHGFVQFAIQPKPGLPIDTKIENNAAIYFDYNEPVITNFAVTEVKLITGIANNKNLDFRLFPNPTNGQLTVDLPFTGNGSWILSDISGRQIEMSNINEGIKTFNLNLNDLPNGTYFLSIQLGNQVSTAKVMKL